MNEDQKRELEEERIRLLHLRYGDTNEEVQAYVAAHGSLPEPKPEPVGTTGDSVITITEAQPVETQPVVERSRRAERAEKIE